MTQRYPLAWPTGRPRRNWNQRVRGSFSETTEAKRSKPVRLQTAIDRLDYQVEALGGRDPILSTNLELRMDGRPRGGQAAPSDPAVALYFTLKGKPYALACDTYTEVAQNIAAVANHIEATRRIERYGVANAEEMFTAFEALPAPKRWWEVLELSATAGIGDVEAAYRAKARAAHPDSGGSTSAMAELNAARDAARKALA